MATTIKTLDGKDTSTPVRVKVEIEFDLDSQFDYDAIVAPAKEDSIGVDIAHYLDLEFGIKVVKFNGIDLTKD